MSNSLNVVAVSGSLHAPSKTTVLVREILGALELALPVETHLIELSEVGTEFSGALNRDQLSARAEAELRQIEGADLLVVASPVYRASFTGLFKHVFDFVGQYTLIDTPVLLAATGGSDRHALILEHQFRPLFSFFQALTLPIGVYANDSDFTNYEVSSDALRARITQAITRGLPLIRASLTGEPPSVVPIGDRAVRLAAVPDAAPRPPAADQGAGTHAAGGVASVGVSTAAVSTAAAAAW